MSEPILHQHGSKILVAVGLSELDPVDRMVSHRPLSHRHNAAMQL